VTMYKVGRSRVYVNMKGDGEPLLFLHGVPDTSEVWDDAIATFSDKYRCIAPNLPGFGRTRAPRNFEYRGQGCRPSMRRQSLARTPSPRRRETRRPPAPEPSTARYPFEGHRLPRHHVRDAPTEDHDTPADGHAGRRGSWARSPDSARAPPGIGAGVLHPAFIDSFGSRSI
jgi:pimeloyl-ACP methyl ester carboxylesterase